MQSVKSSVASSRAFVQPQLKARSSTRRVVFTRVEPNSKVVREYREDDDKVIVPGKNADGTVYADVAQRQMPKKKDNLSKEMKAKLRAEYVGLGGAENKGLRSSRQRPVVMAAMTKEDVAVATSSTTTQPKVGASKWVIDENELLSSNWEHRAWTFGCMGLLAATWVQAVNQVLAAGAAGAWSTFGLSFFAAYALADLGTGIYHWFVDNYGDGTTPVFGRQIAAFQGHHQRPWTITQREFCNNVHQVFKPAAFAAAFFLAISNLTPLWFNAWVAPFIFFVCMSQQFHAWSHMKKSELPGIVVALQDMNLLISRKAHGAHHRAPFDCNYCIVSGWWNPLLDRSGIFPVAEKFVHKVTGIEPRSWHPPLAEWMELERPTSA